MTGLTRKQAAALAGVSEQTINGWRGSGYLHQPYTVEKVLAAQQAVHAGEVVPRWRADPVYAGQRLRALREGAGLNQQQLARQADLTHEEISRLEHGDKCPQALTVQKLSRALGVPPEQFVDDAPLGLELLTTEEAGQRLDIPGGRVRKWMQQGVLPGVKVSGEWRVPAIAVAELDRSGRLRGASRRLDPRYRG
jgi:excisionase family DNA binding protein